MSVSNIHGIKLDLSWFNIVTSLVSTFGILIGSCRTVKPVQEETNGLVGFLILIPLFLFRMTSWMIIIAILHSFSLAVFAGIVLLNIVIFILAQKPIRVEPLTHSFLSLILPVPFLPSSKIENKDGLKLLFWLILIGNLTLIGVLALLFFLYNSDKYNPWCSNVNNNLQIPETMMDHSQYFILALFASATIPLVVCFLLQKMG
jgi:hypothetical protein